MYSLVTCRYRLRHIRASGTWMVKVLLESNVNSKSFTYFTLTVLYFSVSPFMFMMPMGEILGGRWTFGTPWIVSGRIFLYLLKDTIPQTYNLFSELVSLILCFGGKKETAIVIGWMGKKNLESQREPMTWNEDNSLLNSGLKCLP